jgi:hypothetical protein
LSLGIVPGNVGADDALVLAADVLEKLLADAGLSQVDVAWQDQVQPNLAMVLVLD